VAQNINKPCTIQNRTKSPVNQNKSTKTTLNKTSMNKSNAKQSKDTNSKYNNSTLKNCNEYEKQILDEILTNVPSVSWDDISGLEKAKQMLMESLILPSQRPDL